MHYGNGLISVFEEFFASIITLYHVLTVTLYHVQEKHYWACSIKRKSLTLMTIIPNARKEKCLLNLAKALKYKVSQIFATFLQYVWQDLPY